MSAPNDDHYAVSPSPWGFVVMAGLLCLVIITITAVLVLGLVR